MASPGPAFTIAATDKAAELAAGEPVAILLIARMHGTSLGLPNPGLLPTKAERDQARDDVAAAIDRLERKDVPVDGQVAITRKVLGKMSGVARLRGASHVVIDEPVGGPTRQFLDGTSASWLRRRLPDGVAVVVVPKSERLAEERRARDAHDRDQRRR